MTHRNTPFHALLRGTTKRARGRAAVVLGSLVALAAPAMAHDDVLFPDGGEVLQPGQLVTLEWTIAISHVVVDWDVYYSTTGNQGPWIPIELGVAPGSFAVGSLHTLEWVVPDAVTQSASVRVQMNGTQAFWNSTSAADFEIAPALGARSCAGQAPNSSGAAAKLYVVGSAGAAANSMSLTVVDLPANALGFALNSTSLGFSLNPGGSQGHLCLGGAIGRHSGQITASNPSGVVLFPLDLTRLPRPSGATAAVAGQTWSFQYWTRDANPAATSNFSDVVSVALL